jgi:hypothetical protein
MEGSRQMKTTRPQKEQALNCPRCNSTNTKFCYYNNYSLTQPRYFCKTCRRYWTEGGSLRNIPVGGGSRKNKRSSTNSSSSTPTSTISTSSPASSSKNKLIPDLTSPPSNFPQSASQNPKIHQGQDLNLAYPPPDHQDYNTISKFIELPYSTTDHHHNKTTHHHQNPSSSSASPQLSAMELLKTGITSRGLSSFMPMNVSDHSNTLYSSGFPLHEFKPSLNFSLEGFQGGYGSSNTLQGVQESSTGARLLFPIEDLKQVPNTSEFEQNRGQGDSNTHGYWNGMLGGGSW